MTESTRALRIGGLFLAILAAALIAGFAFTRHTSSPTVTDTPTATATDVKAQIETAYLSAWSTWADALRTLDSSHLSGAMTGDALAVVMQQVADARGKNQPMRIEVEHNYTIALVDSVTASVDDHYINHSVRLDPRTGRPVGPVPSVKTHKSFTMKLVNGTWKLAEVIGFSS